jgi:hypothetical protein
MAGSPKHSLRTSFTRSCRDFISMLSYEDILSWTVYVPPMLMMAGPAAIVSNNPLGTLVLNAIVGCVLGWTLHRVGHRLLMGLPNDARPVYLSLSVRLPVTLTRIRFVWMLEMMVAAAVFSAILGKRFLLSGDPFSLVAGALCFIIGLCLYFLPIYLARLWIERHYPAMPLSGPTDEVVSKSLLVFAPFQ